MDLSNEDLVASNPLYQILIDGDPDASYPWTNNLEDIAVEEEEIPIPCGFTYALHIMLSTEDQQLLEYQTLLETRVDPVFAAHVPII